MEAFYSSYRDRTKDDALKLQRYQHTPMLRAIGRRAQPELDEMGRPVSCLHIAVAENNTQLVVLFVKNGVDPDVTYGGDYCEYSPITLAVELDYLDTFRKLSIVSRVLAGERRKEILSQFLTVASEVGSKHIVEELLQHAADEGFIENELFQDAVEQSCVNALRRGHSAISDMLTKAMRGKNLNEALREAVKKGMTDIVQRLIVKGADVNDTDGHEESMPLMLAIKHEQLDVLPILMVNSNDIPETFWSELAAASDEFSRNAIEIYRNIRYGGDKPEPLIFTEKKVNALHIAAAMDKVETLYQFLDLGARHDLVDDFGNSMLHWAARNEAATVIKDFADYFAPNMKNKDGDTALHIACKNARPKAAQVLLQTKGIDLKVRNLVGDTCLHSAVRKLLETKQARTALGSPMKTLSDVVKIPFAEPTREDKLETVNIVARAFRAAGLLNEKDGNGNTVVSILVQAGREKEVPILSGSSPTMTNKENKCAIDYAMLVYSTKPHLISALLSTFGTSAAVYLATRYREGKMPLHVFAEYGEVDKVQLMTQHGASVTDFNGDGNTIMHLLAELAVTDSKNCDTYLKMARVIVETLVNFRFRRQMHLYEFLRNQWPDIFNKLDDIYQQPLIAQHIPDEDLEILVMIYLTRKLKNRDGLSVINYAATIKSMQFLTYLLDVKKVEVASSQNGDVKHDSDDDDQAPMALNGYDEDESSYNFMEDEIKMAIYNVNYLSPESLRGLSVADCDWLQEIIQETFIITLYPVLGKSLLGYLDDAEKDNVNTFKSEFKTWAIIERFDSLRESEEVKRTSPRRGTNWRANSECEDMSPLKKKKSEKRRKSTKKDMKDRKKSSLPSSSSSRSQATSTATIELSLLEMIIDMKDEIAAAEIIDIMPLTKLVQSYWAAYRWVYFLIMLVHIAYMSAFSAHTISDEGKAHCRNSTNATERNTTVQDESDTVSNSLIHHYMIFLFYPFVFLGVTVYFEAVQFIAQYRRSRGRGSQPLSVDTVVDFLSNIMDLPYNGVKFILSYFPTIGCIAYTTCMMKWYYEFTHCGDMEAYYHSACIIVGWLLTITYR